LPKIEGNLFGKNSSGLDLDLEMMGNLKEVIGWFKTNGSKKIFAKQIGKHMS
jgi:hypothetical protein